MASASLRSLSPKSLAYWPTPVTLARSNALAGLTPSLFWLSRSQRAAPPMAASSRPTWKRPTSLQMSPSPPWPPPGIRPSAAAP
eukprot:5554362-Alexandrium_andersonii.AAC.1